MNRSFYKTLLRRAAAMGLALSLMMGASAPQASYADVIDGDTPVESVVMLGEVFFNLNNGAEMSGDDYRSFFDDMRDTSEVLEADFELNKKQLQMVAGKLDEFKAETLAELSTFEEVKKQYDARLSYYEMIKSAVMTSGLLSTEEDGSTSYTLATQGEGNFTHLNIEASGAWSLTEQKDGVLYNLAHVSDTEYRALKASVDYADATMIAGRDDDLYIGDMSDFVTKTGTGTKYNLDGSIDSGKWANNERDGFHYIYNVEEAFEAVNQFKDGMKHGMSSYKEFDSEHIITRIFLNDKISGYSYSEYYYDGYNAEVMNYYKDEVQLPLTYINYPNNDLTRILVGEPEEQIEIYDSGKYDRFFIAEFKDGRPDGFGYTQYGEIEYIGSFKGFDILGDGYYYHIDDEENVFDAKVEEILDEIIERDMTDRQKLLAIHDYIVDEVKYHKPYADISEHPGSTHTAYGALVDGVAVCDGYAQAFKVLADELGFDNHLIFGITVDADGVFQDYNRHAWNIVEYNGEYTHFDTTWDDPSFTTRIRYKYYFIDSEEISEDHQWIEEDYDMYLAPAQGQ